MFGSKSCHVRVAIDAAANITLFTFTFSSVQAKRIFDEWTYECVFVHIHFPERFLKKCVFGFLVGARFVPYYFHQLQSVILIEW